MSVQLLAGGSSGASFRGGLDVSIAGLQAQLLEVQANLSAAANITAGLHANLSVDPTVTLRSALGFAADATAAIALAGPSLTAGLNAGLDAQLGLSADLSAKLGTLNLELAKLQAQLSALAGVFVYLYTGPPGRFGAEIAERISADVDVAFVTIPVLVATSTASATAMLTVLGL